MTEEVKRDRLEKGSDLLERKNDFTSVVEVMSLDFVVVHIIMELGNNSIVYVSIQLATISKKLCLYALSNQYIMDNLNKHILLNVTKFMSNFLCFTEVV